MSKHAKTAAQSHHTSNSTLLPEPVPLDAMVEDDEAANALAVALASAGPALIILAEWPAPPPPTAELVNAAAAPLDAVLVASNSASCSEVGDPAPLSCEGSCSCPSRPSIRANHVRKGAPPKSCMCDSPAPNGHSSNQIAQPTTLHDIATMPNGRPTMSVQNPIQTITPRSEQQQHSKKGLKMDSTSRNTTYPRMATSTMGKLMALQRYISTLFHDD
mmetsp:Transcript_9430/g.17105  ORF Transcript_9430/g.17105 Transcript_9430/m.17105 type:complete len:217 (-) Transcript_9430:889-1539(-)